MKVESNIEPHSRRKREDRERKRKEEIKIVEKRVEKRWSIAFSVSRTRFDAQTFFQN